MACVSQKYNTYTTPVGPSLPCLPHCLHFSLPDCLFCRHLFLTRSNHRPPFVPPRLFACMYLSTSASLLPSNIPLVHPKLPPRIPACSLLFMSASLPFSLCPSLLPFLPTSLGSSLPPCQTTSLCFFTTTSFPPFLIPVLPPLLPPLVPLVLLGSLPPCLTASLSLSYHMKRYPSFLEVFFKNKYVSPSL